MRYRFLHYLSALLPPLFALPVAGQKQYTGIGVKIAAQWTTQRGSGVYYAGVPGGAAGLYVPIWVGPRFEMQPELLASVQGATLERADVSTDLQMIYLHVPITAKFFLTNAFHVDGGLLGGKLLAAKADGADVTEDYLPYDFGFLMGLGVDTYGGFDIALRYYSGFTPVLANDSQIYPLNRSVQLSLGYRVLQLKHRRFRHRG